MSKIKDQHFIFDVDGCITPKNEPIREEIYGVILELAKKNKVSIATGSEISNTFLQVGRELVDNFYMCFNCMGNVVYKEGELIRQNFWIPKKRLFTFLINFISSSKFPFRTAKHLELRTGSMNVSVVGRNATPEQREKYMEYDSKEHERLKLAELLTKEFKDIEISIGGNVSIDICPKGKNKSQILKYLNEERVVYFGDGCGRWGNDQPVFDIIKEMDHAVGHEIEQWKETMDILLSNYKNNL